MCENLGKLEELLNRINIELDSIERLFVGDKPQSNEICEELRDNCIMDTTIKNLQKAENALCTLERIDMILKGGNK